TEADTRLNGPCTVILSYSFWENAFGRRADILGKTIRLDDDLCAVIGVMPPGFMFPTRDGTLWKSMALNAPGINTRGNEFLKAIGRLKPGVQIEQAQSEMSVIADRLAREYPKENANVGASIAPLRDQVSSQTRILLLALFGASLCVLLIACTNL